MNRRVILPIAILLFGVIGAVVMIKARPGAKTVPPSDFAPLVRVVAVEPTDLVLEVHTNGTVLPRTETAVVAEVAGRVHSIASGFASGGFFSRGETLVSIDSRDHELALVQAKGVLAQARLRAELERAQADVAREEWSEIGEGDPSPLASREIQVAEADAAVAAAEAAVEIAERNLGRTRISVPFDGRIRKKLVDVGSFVAPGTPVALAYAVDYVEVRLPISDSDLAYLDIPFDFGSQGREEGPEVILAADFAGNRHQWRGTIVRLEGEIDAVSRMVHAVAQIDDPYRRGGEESPGEGTGATTPPLAVGLFVDAVIYGKPLTGVYPLPHSVLRPDGRAMIVDEDDKLRLREVSVVRRERNRVLVSGGLAPGDRVCTSLLDAVTEGMTVRVQSTGESAR